MATFLVALCPAFGSEDWAENVLHSARSIWTNAIRIMMRWNSGWTDRRVTNRARANRDRVAVRQSPRARRILRDRGTMDSTPWSSIDPRTFVSSTRSARGS